MPKPDWYKKASKEEQKQYDLAVEMADLEFENEIAAYLGDFSKDVVDADRVAMTQQPVRGRAAEYVPPYGGRAMNLSENLQNRGLLERGSYVEPDTVMLFGGRGTTGGTPAHEFLHRNDVVRDNPTDLGAHLDVYGMMGFRATTREEWQDVVQSYANFRAAMGVTPEVDLPGAEEDLRIMIQDRQDVYLDREAEAGATGNTALSDEYRPDDTIQDAYRKQAEAQYHYRKRRSGRDR